MILMDFSSAFHKTVHRLAKAIGKGSFVNLLGYSQEFYLSLLELIQEHSTRFRQYGELVICLDDKSGAVSWRKEIYPMYKQQRKEFRESQTAFDYADAYVLHNQFLEEADKLGYKVIGVPTCEADDIILVLGEYCGFANQDCLILSPDKDFIQLQKYPNIHQFSWMTNKMVTPEDKGSLEAWELEHICMGDVSDNVPRICDFQEFNPGVREYLIEEKGWRNPDPYLFSCTFYDPHEFGVFGGAFKRQKFGVAGLRKLVEKAGGLEELLESNPTFKKNYYRNRQLVMAEGIPQHLKVKIMQAYKTPPAVTDLVGFCENLGIEANKLPSDFAAKYMASGNIDWTF